MQLLTSSPSLSSSIISGSYTDYFPFCIFVLLQLFSIKFDPSLTFSLLLLSLLNTIRFGTFVSLILRDETIFKLGMGLSLDEFPILLTSLSILFAALWKVS